MKLECIIKSIIAATMTLSLLLFSAPACSGKSPDSSVLTEKKKNSLLKDTPESKQWVDSVYNTLDLEGRVAQLFVPRLDISDNAAGRSTLSKMVSRGIGGFLLGKGSIKDYTELINLGQKDSRIPLMVTLDGEWGLAMRIPDTPRFPYNMGLGAIKDESLLYDYGKEVARECKAMGIQVDFAPVLDVNSNPANPVIGYRSFGENPERVAALGTAFSRGMEDGGVMSVAKHFPGHGDTSTDSHKTLPTVSHSMQQLENIDLLPFKTYVDEGLSGIMVGHLFVPALDNSGAPSSLSSKITTELLKERLGFKGIVFTDALAMKGANSSENNCVRALKAGADILLGSSSPLTDIEAVVKAVRDGKISEKTIEERCKKVLAYKWSFGLANKPDSKDASAVSKLINTPEAESVNRRLSAASITCVFNYANLIPIRGLRYRTVAVVSIGAKAENNFTKFCRKYADVEAFSTVDGQLTSAQLTSIKKHDVVVVGIFSDSKNAQAAFAQLDGVNDVVPVFFVNPYKMGKFANSIKRHKTLVTAYDNTPYLQEYAAQALFGGIPINGTLPVNVKGVASMGTGVEIEKSRLGYSDPNTQGFSADMEERLDKMIEEAISQGAFPGCQVLVARNGEVVHDKAYGKTTKAQWGVPVTDETRYDVASMTKAITTLSGLMKVYDEGNIALDKYVRDYIPETRSLPVGDITIKELLFHESGLPSGLNVYNLVLDSSTYSGKPTSNKLGGDYSIKISEGVYGNDKAKLRTDIVSSKPTKNLDIKIGENLYVGYCTYDTIMNRIYNLKPRSKAYKYSDLNFCLLKAIQENASSVALDQWVDTEIFEPLGAYNSSFCPVQEVELDKIAPTETDNYLRRQTMHGFVHDELASFSGGVQGNAGLFTNADDVAKVCQMLLNGGNYGGEQILKPSTVKTFTTTRSASGRRGLGYDIKEGGGNRPTMFGHTGFTGTCFWIDPVNNIVFVFLSNRVNPTRDNAAFKRSDIRNRLLDEVYRSMCN